MLIAGDQTPDLGGAGCDGPRVRGRPAAARARRDVLVDFDAFLVVLREMVVVAKVVGKNRLAHRDSLPLLPYGRISTSVRPAVKSHKFFRSPSARAMQPLVQSRVL